MTDENPMTRSSLDPQGDVDAAAAELAWALRAGQAETVMRRTAVRVRRRRVRLLATGLGVMCLAALTWVSWSGYPTGKAQLTAVVASTVVSSVDTRTLADGTVAELSRGAQLVVDYSAARRHVTLIRGNAHFEVTKDPTRPFVVTAGDVDARALGTAFAVQFGVSTVEVLVTHGTVQVDRAGAGSSPVSANQAKGPDAILHAGNRVVVDLAAGSPLTVETVSGTEASERLAWRVPLLEFSGTPLSEVIALFNRYGSPRLVFGDDAIRSLQLSGVLRAGNTDLLLRLLEAEFGIRAEQRQDEIVLRR